MAEWSAAYVNDLPDSSFAYIEPGGKKDGGGKTTPRSLRHFPYKDKNGKLDAAHVRNALARIPQSKVSAAAKKAALAKVQAAANKLGIGAAKKSLEEGDDMREAVRQNGRGELLESLRRAGYVPFTFTTDAVIPGVAGHQMADVRIKALPMADDNVKRVSMTASTTEPDMYGDIFGPKAQKSMETQAPGTTIFLNHQTKVPEDVFGAVERATLVTRKGENDEQVLALDFVVAVEDSNPRAQLTFEQIDRGIVNLGASITAYVPKGSPPSGVGRGSLYDGDVFYVESSVVGVPINRGSWLHQIRRALESEAALDEGGTDEIEPGTAAPDAEAGDEATASAAPPAESEAPPEAAAAAASAAADEMARGLDPHARHLVDRLRAARAATDVTVDEFTAAKIKGMFADVTAERVNSPYFIIDNLMTAIYRLKRMREASASAGAADTFDYQGAVDTMMTEFTGVMGPACMMMLGMEAAESPEAVVATLGFCAAAGETLAALEDLIEVSKGKSADGTTEMIQSMHDITQKMGANCGSGKRAKKTGLETEADGGLNVDDEQTVELIRKSAPFVALETRLRDVEEDREGLEAVASKALEALNTVAKIRLPRAGA